MMARYWREKNSIIRFLQGRGRNVFTRLRGSGARWALPPLEINGEMQEVVEGTGAVRAYFAMAYGLEREDETAKKQWSQLLLEYCKFDTLAMVLIWEHWQRITKTA